MTNLFYQFTKPTAPIFFPGAPFAAAAVLVAVAILFVSKGLMQNNIAE